MFAKFSVILALVAVARGGVLPVAPVGADYSSFAYDVADPNTGDYKSQVETRSGGNVVGQYSLLDADGTKRTVDYSADDVNGFNAVVRKDPVLAAAPAVVAAPAPAVVATPVAAAPAVVAARTYSAPAVYTAPVVAGRTYAAPTVYASSPVVASTYTAAAPVFTSTYAAAAPVVAARSYSSVYSANPVVSSYYAW